jgi:PAS domain S-box-containing protein
MPWVEELSDLHALRRCIRDLVALSTLPTIWRDFDPPQIIDSVSAALLSMLDADFVHAALPEQHDAAMVEVTHVGSGMPSGSLGPIRTALRAAPPIEGSEQTLSIPDLVGDGIMRIAIAPIGVGGDAILLVAGSRQPEFPSEVQRLLLGIGANDATIALQRCRAEADRRRFVTLVERSSDFIAVVSVNGRPQYINRAGAKLVGLSSAEQLSGMSILDFLTSADRSRAREKLWPEVLRNGRWVGELEFCHLTTGAAIPGAVDWFRIDHPRTGQPIEIATVTRDLRSEKQAEADLHSLNESLERRVSDRTNELAQANDRLVGEQTKSGRVDARLQEAQLELWHATRVTAAGHLAGALAHELNQPLTAIVNSMNAARRLLADGDTAKAAKIPDMLRDAVGQALRGGQIIGRLREFVRRGETDKRIENMRSVIEEACALALTGSTASGVDVQYRLEPAAVKAFVNRIQIQQVIVNVIHNAIEAMAGTERREIEIATALLGPELLEISIADSGPGLAEDIAEHLFEPFVSGKRDGMGLGLSIARSIVEAHGGKIRADANPEGGTILRFTLGTSDDGARGAG